ncbi:LAMI_0F03444g1_1 [Lachancea mirantina]|uniref:Protein farnesyltransferase/geranylgeranyltransferase type-1 subunit alpha n=1 Tax=Lachancea mirantina TaxID=1230905 RepID=A0A1G4JXC9_9SACH|nr:LAMI_0F03444g1_1 [Lachancea mirantina]
MVEWKFDYSDLDKITENKPETGPGVSEKGELCGIMYDDEYKEIMRVFRGVLSLKEKSERALYATEVAILAVPAFYTAWNYRFDIVKALYGDSGDQLDRELDWLDEFTLANPKNYQIWSYRQAVLKVHPKPIFRRELPILAAMLDEDSKNYHVWSYRRWCVQFFGVLDEELTFADALIVRDVFNNSAWCHRMFVMKELEVDLAQRAASAEIEYAKAKILIAPQNISPWNYLRGIYNGILGSQFDAEIVTFALAFAGDVFDAHGDASPTANAQSSFALEFLAAIYSQNEETAPKAIAAYNALSSKYDPIRKSLWDHKIARLRT